MANIHVDKGGGQYAINAAKKRKEQGCMTFGKNRMIRECVSIYYDEPTYSNCLFFLGPDISKERYKELTENAI